MWRGEKEGDGNGRADRNGMMTGGWEGGEMLTTLFAFILTNFIFTFILLLINSFLIFLSNIAELNVI